MKVVIDTNVFVSGIFWKGTPLKVLERWRAGDFQLVISPAILNEYQRVIDELTRQHPSSDAAAMMDLVKINAKMTNPVSLVRPVWILSLAGIASKALYPHPIGRGMFFRDPNPAGFIARESRFWRLEEPFYFWSLNTLGQNFSTLRLNVLLIRLELDR